MQLQKREYRFLMGAMQLLHRKLEGKADKPRRPRGPKKTPPGTP
jgi:hypothetical protein